MAVACRILVQIFLMILLGRVELVQRQHFNGQSLPGVGRFFIPYFFDRGQESTVLIVDAGPVLNAAVVALAVDGERIDGHEIIVQELVQRQDRFVIDDSDGLGVTAPAAYVLVRGTVRGPVGISVFRFKDAGQLIDKLLGSQAAPA